MAEGKGAGRSSEPVVDLAGAATPGVATPRSVFLSYASADATIAQTIVQNLESHGVRCWMAPRDVRPGTQYAEAIVRAINEATSLVLVLSANAVASTHVGKEVERASSKRKPIIAFRVDAAALSPALEYFLSESQWIDVPALGMPAALARLAEAIGQGAQGTTLVKPGMASAGKRSPPIVVAALVLALVGVAVALGVHYWSAKPRSTQSVAVAPIADKSIAVLPFVDMSEKKDQEYFADGMSEEILDLLTKIPGLAVIGRTSSFQFKGKNEDLRTIGAKLNAAYVLEGSVRNSGDQVRITAQLINTRTGTHEWSEIYDRRFDDVLKLQDAIAAAVVRELQLTVATGRLDPRSTLKDPEAYDLILRARHAVDRFDREGLDEAVALAQRALDRDPTSADAAAALALAYYYQGAFGVLAPAVAFEQSRRAAGTALKLDTKTELAHYVLAKIGIVYDWDWMSAGRELQQVAALAPGSAEVLNGEARLSLALGRWDEALRHVEAALAQDPLDPNSFEALTLIQARLGHLAEGEAAARRALDIRPTYTWGHFYLGLALLARGERETALLEMQRDTSEEGRLAGLAMAYYALGRRAESDAALASMIKEHAGEYAFYIAEAYAFRGQSDEAVHWLERAYAQKDPYLCYLKPEFAQKRLAADPNFKAFLRKMNLPE
jgi:TolB-like protein